MADKVFLATAKVSPDAAYTVSAGAFAGPRKRPRSGVLQSLLVGLMLLAGAAEVRASNGAGAAFSRQSVIDLARELARSPFEPLPQAPPALAELDYSTYRQINYRQDRAVWGATPTRFTVELFAPGFLYRDLVDIDVVENGRARPLAVAPDSFRVPESEPELTKVFAQVGKYAGLRLHYPLNSEQYKDEFLVFQGASFFRGVSRGQVYGLSARGLAIDVAEPTGEEYPVFRRFWVERPASEQQAIVVHALLDSRRVTGAFRFGIYPGDPLRMDVEVTLFARERVANLGLAPLTSMFMHGGVDPGDIPDYRPAVHDSGGLAVQRGNGERLWRPLSNPRNLQTSAFIDRDPGGFGLMQRSRDFADYQDLEARYDLRPSAWVQPLGEWGPGHVRLVEIPSPSEANDNIVAYWQPEGGLPLGEAFSYAYRLTWPDDAPGAANLARVVRSAGGQRLSSSHRQMVIDWADTGGGSDLVVDASISAGTIIESTVQDNPFIHGSRVFVTFDPGDVETAELRVRLLRKDRPAGETWLYRWLDEQ